MQKTRDRKLELEEREFSAAENSAPSPISFLHVSFRRNMGDFDELKLNAIN